MSLVASALQPHLVEGLISLRGRVPDISLPDALIEPGAAYVVDFDNPQKSFSIDFRDTRWLVNAIASDACRLAGASFQTIERVADDLLDGPRVAWAVVHLY